MNGAVTWAGVVISVVLVAALVVAFVGNLAITVGNALTLVH